MRIFQDFFNLEKKNYICYNVGPLNFHAKYHYDGCDHFTTISNTVNILFHIFRVKILTISSWESSRIIFEC